MSNEQQYYSVTLHFVSGDSKTLKWSKENWNEIHQMIQGIDGFKLRTSPRNPTEGWYINFRHVEMIIVEEWTDDKEEGWFK